MPKSYKTKTLFFSMLYHKARCIVTNQIPPYRIDFLRALEKACLNCGDKHQQNCPVGLAKAQINSTNELLTEFYKAR